MKEKRIFKGDVFDNILHSEVSTKESYNALAFYEKHVDNLGFVFKDEDYPDFNFDVALSACLVGSKGESTHYGGRRIKVYSQMKFKQIVSNFFNTTIKEMDIHWRHFK